MSKDAILSKVENKLLEITVMSKQEKINELNSKTNTLITQNTNLQNLIKELTTRNIQLLKNEETIDKQKKEIMNLKHEIEQHIIKFDNYAEVSGFNNLKKEYELLTYKNRELEKLNSYHISYKEKNIELNAHLQYLEKHIENLEKEFIEKFAKQEIENDFKVKEIWEKVISRLEIDHKELESLIQSKISETYLLVNNQNKKLLYESNCILYKNDELEKKFRDLKIKAREKENSEKVSLDGLEEVTRKNIELEKLVAYIIMKTTEIIEREKQMEKIVNNRELEIKGKYERKINKLEKELNELKLKIQYLPDFLKLVTDVIVNLYNENSDYIMNEINYNNPISKENDDLHDRNMRFFNLKNARNINFSELNKEDKLNLLILIMERLSPIIRKTGLFKISTSNEILNYKLNIFDTDTTFSKKDDWFSKIKFKTLKEKESELDQNIVKTENVFYKLSKNGKKYVYKETYDNWNRKISNLVSIIEKKEEEKIKEIDEDYISDKKEIEKYDPIEDLERYKHKYYEKSSKIVAKNKMNKERFSSLFNSPVINHEINSNKNLIEDNIENDNLESKRRNINNNKSSHNNNMKILDEDGTLTKSSVDLINNTNNTNENYNSKLGIVANSDLLEDQIMNKKYDVVKKLGIEKEFTSIIDFFKNDKLTNKRHEERINESEKLNDDNGINVNYLKKTKENIKKINNVNVNLKVKMLGSSLPLLPFINDRKNSKSVMKKIKKSKDNNSIGFSSFLF